MDAIKQMGSRQFSIQKGTCEKLAPLCVCVSSHISPLFFHGRFLTILQPTEEMQLYLRTVKSIQNTTFSRKVNSVATSLVTSYRWKKTRQNKTAVQLK